MKGKDIFKELNDLDLRPNDISDAKLSKAFAILLEITEEPNLENEKLKSEIEWLRKENKNLKGEKDDSDNDMPREKPPKDHSSEKAGKKRGSPREGKRKPKKDKIHADRTEYCPVDRNILPEDAEFKGWQDIVTQELAIKTDNVPYKKEVWYSKSENKTYIGIPPVGFGGEFGPGVKSMTFILKHVCNMSEPKITEFFNNFGIHISQSTISRMLTGGSDIEIFHGEKAEIFEAGLHSTPWQNIDGTGAKVRGGNHHVQIVCNPFYSAFFTCPRKDRLTIIDILLCGNPRFYLFNEKAFALLEEFGISGKMMSKIRDAVFGGILDEDQMRELLDCLFPDPGKGRNNRLGIMEAGAIAWYHKQTNVPVVQILLGDAGPEYKKMTPNQGLCWIHDGRHYGKLNPVVPMYRESLENFKARYWDFYQKILDYKDDPSREGAEKLSSEFDDLFSTVTDYPALNDRIEKTKAKKAGLLTILQHPEIDPHNNTAELGARVVARKRDVSLHTMSADGTASQDTMLTIMETARKLGVNAYNHIFDRISGKFELPSLSSLILKTAGLVVPCPDSS